MYGSSRLALHVTDHEMYHVLRAIWDSPQILQKYQQAEMQTLTTEAKSSLAHRMSIQLSWGQI